MLVSPSYHTPSLYPIRGTFFLGSPGFVSVYKYEDEGHWTGPSPPIDRIPNRSSRGLKAEILWHTGTSSLRCQDQALGQ